MPYTFIAFTVNYAMNLHDLRRSYVATAVVLFDANIKHLYVVYNFMLTDLMRFVNSALRSLLVFSAVQQLF